MAVVYVSVVATQLDLDATSQRSHECPHLL